MNESAPQPASSVLALVEVSKQFAGVQALDNVSFDLAPGEIHALLGENGAGKSTLIKVMTGAYVPNAGHILSDGKPLSLHSPADAQAAGISTVYQEVNLLPNLSVAHNLYLGREPRRFGCIDWRTLHDRARVLLQRFHLDIDVTQPLSVYSLAIQQLVAIARGIDQSARVLVLDEPTASLDRDEVTLLFSLLRELKAQGMAIVFITHFLDQVYEISDRITVLRNGSRVGTFVKTQLPRHDLVGHMLGRELAVLEAEARDKPSATTGEPLLVASNVTSSNGLHGISFAVAKGQVLGLSGLLGAGRTEVCETLFGLASVTGGNVAIAGQAVMIHSPRQAVGHALALCPEDRKHDGIVGELSIRENLMLARQARQGWLKPVSRHEQQRLAQTMIADLQIACPNAEKAVGELSGGNQQKVVLGRWLITQPNVLILDEPTRGIDIGAHAEIIRLIRRLCAQGMTVIVASSEIEELLALCDQVVVMREKRVQAHLQGEQISEQHIMTAMASGAGT